MKSNNKLTSPEIEKQIVELERLHKETSLENHTYKSRISTKIPEIFKIIELIHDTNGKAIDYYYREVNPAMEKRFLKKEINLLASFQKIHTR